MSARWRVRVVAVNDAGRAIGEDHETARLSNADIDLIHELAAAGLSVRQIAAKFDDWPRVSKSHVHMVLRGKRRAHMVMGHKHARRDTRHMPADLDEFEDLTKPSTR